MAQTINIQRLWDQKYRDESVPFLIDGSPTSTTYFDVRDYGAKVDNATDDTAAIQAALDAAHTAAVAGGRVGPSVYIPGPCAISAPLYKGYAGLIGATGRAELTALPGFSGGNHMVRTWKNSDYGGGETDHTQAPLHEATPIVFHHVEGIRFNLGAVANLRGLGVAHPHESSVLRDLIFNDPGTNGVGLHLPVTLDSVINGKVLVDGVTFYATGWGSEIIVGAGGSDLTLRRWTASPGAHSASVLDVACAGFVMEDSHCEGYVDPALFANTDLATWRFRSSTPRVMNSTIQINPTSTILKHPAIYTDTGSGFTSPVLVGLRTSAGAGSGWDAAVPMIKDRAESNIFFSAGGQEYQEIYYYDGNVISWRKGSSPSRGYFQTLRGKDQNTVTYSANMTVDASLGEYQYINVSDNSAMTITPAIPNVALNGMRMIIQIQNSTGGAMGTITWSSAFKLAGAFTNPAGGQKSRFIEFMYDGGTHWYEINRGAADV
jgi:hypothetical protein